MFCPGEFLAFSIVTYLSDINWSNRFALPLKMSSAAPYPLLVKVKVNQIKPNKILLETYRNMLDCRLNVRALLTEKSSNLKNTSVVAFAAR